MTKTEQKAARERILDAAQELFAKQGFDATTTKSISQAAGVATGLVFHYFGSKQDILESLISERTVANELHTLIEASLGGDPRSTLERVGERFIGALKTEKELVRILFQDWFAQTGSGAGEPTRLRQLFLYNLEALTRLLETAKREQHLTIEHPEVTAKAFMAAVLFQSVFLGEAKPDFVKTLVASLLGPHLEG